MACHHAIKYQSAFVNTLKRNDALINEAVETSLYVA